MKVFWWYQDGVWEFWEGSNNIFICTRMVLAVSRRCKWCWDGVDGIRVASRAMFATGGQDDANDVWEVQGATSSTIRSRGDGGIRGTSSTTSSVGVAIDGFEMALMKTWLPRVPKSRLVVVLETLAIMKGLKGALHAPLEVYAMLEA